MRKIWLIFPVAVAVGMSGCDDGGASSADRAGEGGVGFELYKADHVDLIDYAVNKLKADCMADAGFPQLAAAGVTKHDGMVRMFAITPARFRGFESEDQARELGFGAGQPAEPGRVVSYDANFDRQLQECSVQAVSQVDEQAGPLVESYIDIGNQMSSEFAQFLRQRIVEDLPALADCLEGEGYPLVDRNAFLENWDVRHFGLETGSLADVDDWSPDPGKGGVQVGPPVQPQRYVPSQQESELAAAWHRCDERSGRVDRLVESANAKAGEIVSRYEDELVEMNEDINEFARVAAGIVGEAS